MREVNVRPFIRVALLTAALSVETAPAEAHKPSDSYLTLKREAASEFNARWDIAVRDLDYALGLDRNGDGSITWGEVRAAQSPIFAYAISRLTVQRGGTACDPGQPVFSLVHHSDGNYVVLSFRITCSGASVAAAVIDLDYRLLFDVDPQHRGIAHMEDSGGGAVIFDIDHHAGRLQWSGPSNRTGDLLAAIRSGVMHIWSGYDHLLFLIALLLPSTLRRAPGTSWAGVPTLGLALREVAKVVTAFTLAHSLTLTLAALGIVTLPSKLVEILIAASVVTAALNNLLPFARAHGWMIAFSLGLLHGFGFSAALTDAGLSGRSLLATLFGFNVGVEMGQLAIVALFVPLAFAARNSWAYRRVVLIGGSAAIVGVSLVWLIQRVMA